MTDELDDETLSAILGELRPEWTLREWTPLDGGASSVAAVTLTDGDRTRERVCKVALSGDHRGVAVDARLTALLGERTDVPVPEVLAALDDHESLPAPAMVQTAVTGEAVPYQAVGRLADAQLRTLAADVGRHLGQLHGIDAVERFGLVGYERSRPLAGERPAGSTDNLLVPDGFEEWGDFLDAWREQELDRHADSEFADRTDRIRTAVGTAPLPENPRPVLGRNDHGLHNLLVDSDTGAVTAALDWAYTLAVTPAFDVAYAVYIYGGGYLSGLSGVRDRRELVREALLAGYREVAPELATRIEDSRPDLQLLAAVRVMNDFDALAGRFNDEEERAALAEGLRENVDTVLAEAEQQSGER